MHGGKDSGVKANPKLDAIVRRPVKLLAQIGSDFPAIWREHDRLRREVQATKKWPGWCYAPLGIAWKCITLPQFGGPSNVSMMDGSLATVVGALASWRLTKGIYLFDETAFDSLWDTRIEGNLPAELLQRLPEWCVYVAFPKRRLLPGGLPTRPDVWTYGFFGHVDIDLDGQMVLHLCVDYDHPEGSGGGVNSFTLALVGDLNAACRQYIRAPLEAVADKHSWESAALLDTASRQERDLIRPLISILLWLCSAHPEISGLDPLRGFRTKKTKKGIRTFGPDQPRVYEVAYRIGAALRLDREAMARGGQGDGSHASPRPHIRRAHWHAFWTGPRAAPGKEQPTERKLILKWIAPIAVCVGTNDPIIPTIHPVLGSVEAL
jgi:hypothetical protein